MITHTEMQSVLNQVNKLFDQYTEKLEALEKKIEGLAKEPVAKKTMKKSK
jgi:tRNA(Phe) wybutosine-synthesizing methylase Tyw3